MYRYLLIALAMLPFATVSAADLPPDSEYVVVDADGHLSIDGERRRFWAVIGKPFIPARVKADDDAETRAAKIERSRKGTDALIERFDALGFNAVRLWNVTTDEAYEVGDGSGADCVDYFLARARDAGLRVWCAGLGNRVGSAHPDQVDIIDDPETAAGWVEAVTEYQGISVGTKKKKKSTDLRHSMARTWDPRLEAIYIERMRANANHVNKHTGLRWCDDPVFAIWELTNEEWWMRRMLSGAWLKEPAFFRNQLIARWQDFLREKYGDDEALRSAWKGLLDGESLGDSTIVLAPMAGKTDPGLAMNDANPHARAALEGMDTSLTRADFDPQRGSDVIEFFLSLTVAHKLRCAEAVRGFGKSTQLGVVIHDTGIGYNIQSQYVHQLADASVHDAYVNGWGPTYKEPDLSEVPDHGNRRMLKQLDTERLAATTGPWNNWLLKPPGIAQGVPWLEHNKVEGKPFLVYETQIQQPAKYRADFPLRLAALASIQDWDWISWHYFASHDEVGVVDNPFERKMDVTYGSHPQGYHFTYDEVQNAMMRQAALIWRGEQLAPPSNPTRFIYGKRSLTHPDSMDYAGSYGPDGMDMLQTVYQHGARIEIDPTREDDEVIGPVVTFEQRTTHNPYTPTDAITFDWKQGYLMFDAPGAVAFTGLLANYGDQVAFANGVELSDVTISNPDGIFSPVSEDERYIAFALTAEDGTSVAESQHLSLSLMSTSFNSGFSIDPVAIETSRYGIPKGSVDPGGLPVLVARVGATVSHPALTGMRYVMRDWHLDEIASGVVEDGSLVVPNDLPVFVVELTR